MIQDTQNLDLSNKIGHKEEGIYDLLIKRDGI